MNLKYRTAALLLAALPGLSQCQKTDPDPASQLPAATQTGANTFGCLLNGQPWTPQGNDGTSNYTVDCDHTPTGVVLDIHAYRIYGKAANEFQSIVLFANQVNGVGSYSFRSPQYTRASVNDEKSNCYWSSRDSATTYRRGTLTITRLDRQAGIVAGTFAFTLYKPGCDSVRVTNGRFDRQL